jgi:hypothetical protein
MTQIAEVSLPPETSGQMPLGGHNFSETPPSAKPPQCNTSSKDTHCAALTMTQVTVHLGPMHRQQWAPLGCFHQGLDVSISSGLGLLV